MCGIESILEFHSFRCIGWRMHAHRLQQVKEIFANKPIDFVQTIGRPFEPEWWTTFFCSETAIE